MLQKQVEVCRGILPPILLFCGANPEDTAHAVRGGIIADWAHLPKHLSDSCNQADCPPYGLSHLRVDGHA